MKKNMKKDTYGNFKSTALIDSDWYVHRACCRMKDKTYKESNLVIIYDYKPTGKATGKTTLLFELCKAIPESCYLTCMQLQLFILNAIKNGKSEDVVYRIGKADLLVIDNLEYICGMEATQEEIGKICLMLSKSMKVVVACGMPVQHLSSFYKMIEGHGAFYHMRGPTLITRFRVALMERKRYGGYLGYWKIWEIVTHSNDDIRQVIGRITTESARRKLIK